MAEKIEALLSSNEKWKGKIGLLLSTHPAGIDMIRPTSEALEENDRVLALEVDGLRYEIERLRRELEESRDWVKRL